MTETKTVSDVVESVKQTAGAVLVSRLEDWLLSYMAMPREYALVCALWAINTWVFKVFDATPYLCITASTKQSGKSQLLEATSFLSKNAELITDPTPSIAYRLLEMYDGGASLFFDEAEKFAHDGHPMRPFMNVGYRAGQSLPRTLPGGKVMKFPVYCPKAFAQIGDVYDTLRDRAIVLWLSRGTPARKFRRSEAEREAQALRVAIDGYIKSGALADIPLQDLTAWLGGRDEEIWLPLISLAYAMGLHRDDLDRLERAAADLTAAKTDKARRYVEFDVEGSEASAQNVAYGERALRDLRAVLVEGERVIFSAVAVERMKAIPTGPWRHFKGTGLSQNSLADLLSPFGLSADPVRVGGRGSERARGFKRAEIVKAVALLEAKP